MSEMYIQNMIPGYFPIFTDVFSQWFSLIERYNQQRKEQRCQVYTLDRAS